MDLKSTSDSYDDSVALPLTDEEHLFIEVIANLVEQWGFKRHLGRVWGILYVRKDPVSPIQLQNLLSLSAGNMNQILSELSTWGVIKKVRVPQDRKSYYVADDHIWKSITNVLRARELRILSEALTSLQTVESNLTSHSSAPDCEYQQAQVKKVKQTLALLENMAKMVTGSGGEQLGKLAALMDKLRLL